MRIAVFETEDWEREACARLMQQHDLVCTREALTGRSAGAYADTDVVATFIHSDLGADILRRLPSLKLVATRSTGYDHIDLAYCRAHAITVCHVPGYGDHTVAEHVFALLLPLARHVVEAAERTRRGNFAQSGLRGFELNGRTLGVVGTGRIGRRVIEIAHGFGMAVMAFDARPDPQLANRLGFRYAALHEVLAASDIVTLHVPAVPETERLIADPQFALMKDGAVLINTARGSVVDIEALVRALASGKLAAAGLDVLPQEPLIREEAQIFRSEAVAERDWRTLVADHVLLRLPNVIVTPHIAYDTAGAVRRIIDTTLDNIEAFACGVPRNVVA